MRKKKTALLGDIEQKPDLFQNLEPFFSELEQPEFRALSARKRFKKINKTLLNLIQEHETPCFLLPGVLDFIARVNKASALNEPYTITSFEFFLNLFSKLSIAENLEVRGKIVGRNIPRNEYQSIFPIGMNKVFPGAHFVAAHLSPDTDTTVASLWGWMDAFGCRVAEGCHQWGLPAIPADTHLVTFLKDFFGASFFDLVMRKNPMLTMTAMDLVTKKDMNKIPASTHLSSVDHSHANKALILVDEEGHFLGEWRSHEAESIRQLISLFCSSLRWFETNFIATITSLMAKVSLFKSELIEAYNEAMNKPIKIAIGLLESTDKQKGLLSDLFKKILKLKSSDQTTFKELLAACDSALHSSFSDFQSHFEKLLNAPIFDAKGQLNNSRSGVMSHFENVIKTLELAVQSIYQTTDRLDVQIKVRDQVLGQPSLWVTLKSDIEEMRNKIENYDFLPVVVHEENGKCFPVGIVRATDLKKITLGTATLRDFSNLEETKLASYVEVISIIDHHKTNIKTSTVSTFTVADSQSSNTLVAELNMAINDRYRESVHSQETLEAKIKELIEKPPTQSRAQLIMSYFHAQLSQGSGYFVHPKREYIEYLCHIFAILDDTDLLSKVSKRDLVCIQALINRMKRLEFPETFDSELIDFSDLPDTQEFVALASKRLLQNADLHSIYSRVYQFKEQEVEADLIQCAKGLPSNIFADTKEQNGCCRISQTKLFSKNYSTFQKNHTKIRELWRSNAEKRTQENPQMDFYLQMVSTVPGAEEVYTGGIKWTHQDEIWIWIPKTAVSRQHLINFLSGFNTLDAIQSNNIEVELFADRQQEAEALFEQNFPRGKILCCKGSDSGVLAILRFKAGMINSRKAQISPYLPKLAS